MSELRAALLAQNDGDEAAADEAIADMVDQCHDGIDPEEVLYDYGLEPDYVFDLIELL